MKLVLRCQHNPHPHVNLHLEKSVHLYPASRNCIFYTYNRSYRHSIPKKANVLSYFSPFGIEFIVRFSWAKEKTAANGA